jgi:hypothetical protein
MPQSCDVAQNFLHYPMENRKTDPTFFSRVRVKILALGQDDGAQPGVPYGPSTPMTDDGAGFVCGNGGIMGPVAIGAGGAFGSSFANSA